MSAEGIAADDNLSERERIVRDIGDKPCLILRNHGLMTIGRTVGEAFTGCTIWSSPAASRWRRSRPARRSPCRRPRWWRGCAPRRRIRR